MMPIQKMPEQKNLFQVSAPPRPAALPLDPRFPTLSADSSLDLAVHWFASWLASKGYADNTRAGYLKAISLFARYVGGRRALSSLTSEDVMRFFAYDEGRGKAQRRASKTIELHGTAVRAFFAALHEAGILKVNLAQRAFPKKGYSPTPGFLFPGQADSIRQTAGQWATDPHDPRPRPYLLVLLMLDMGLRLMEVESLSLDDVDMSNPMRTVVYVRPRDPRHKAKQRACLAPPDFGRALQLYRQTHDVHEGRLFPVERRTLQLEIENLGRAAGLSVRLSPETLRWTFALTQFRAGAPEDRLRRQLGLSKLGWQDARRKLEQMASPAM